MENILLLLGSNVASIILTTIVNRRSIKIDNDSRNDDVLIKRVEFLDKRITALEESACFKKNCADRQM